MVLAHRNTAHNRRPQRQQHTPRRQHSTHTVKTRGGIKNNKKVLSHSRQEKLPLLTQNRAYMTLPGDTSVQRFNLFERMRNKIRLDNPDDPSMNKGKTFKQRVVLGIIKLVGARPPPPSINVEEFALLPKLFNVIVDVRPTDQRQHGYIPNSLHIPLDSLLPSRKENLSIQFKGLTMLVYDQDGSKSPEAAYFLRDCGAEAWSLEGGAEAFREFVQQTQDGTYIRKTTLEDAKEHVRQQALTGFKTPRLSSLVPRESWMTNEQIPAVNMTTPESNADEKTTNQKNNV